MHEDNRKKKANKEIYLPTSSPIYFLATELLQREILTSLKNAVIGFLLTPFVHSSTTSQCLFFPDVQVLSS